MNENKVKVWLARDWNGALCVHCTEPFKDCRDWISYNHGNLEDHYFPYVKWEDEEPTEAYITLAEPQEQPQTAKQIDWEQRRYEMIKEMMIRKWLSDKIINDRQFPYSENDDVASAIKCADKLINELKKQSK